MDVRDVIPCEGAMGIDGHRDVLQFEDLLSKTRVGSRNNNNFLFTLAYYRLIIDYSCTCL